VRLTVEPAAALASGLRPTLTAQARWSSPWTLGRRRCRCCLRWCWVRC